MREGGGGGWGAGFLNSFLGASLVWGNVNSRKPVKCILVHFGTRKINLARKRAPFFTHINWLYFRFSDLYHDSPHLTEVMRNKYDGKIIFCE